MQTLRRIWFMWKRAGTAIGNAIGRLVLTVFYFTLLAPFGIGVRAWGDPLDIKKQHGTKWTRREADDSSLDSARRLG